MDWPVPRASICGRGGGRDRTWGRRLQDTRRIVRRCSTSKRTSVSDLFSTRCCPSIVLNDDLELYFPVYVRRNTIVFVRHLAARYRRPRSISCFPSSADRNGRGTREARNSRAPLPQDCKWRPSAWSWTADRVAPAGGSAGIWRRRIDDDVHRPRWLRRRI